MSKELMMAVLGIVGAVLGGAISGLATLIATKKDGREIAGAVTFFVALIGGAGGLALGLALGAGLLQPQFGPEKVATAIPTLPPQAAVESEGTGPFRQHHASAIGTGAFAQVTSSDGLAPYDEAWLATYHFRIQRIRPEENPDGCGVSVFETNKVWFGATANTRFTVNGDEIGRLVVTTGSHGYVFSWPVHVGDELCVVGFDPNTGYHIIIGPDIYYHYDSYCYRGHCD